MELGAAAGRLRRLAADFGDRAALRHDLGYREHELVCIVTVGGSAVGAPLLRRVIASFPEAKRLVPQLRMIVVAGPRIDPATLPAADGLEVRPYVHNLYRHLASRNCAAATSPSSKAGSPPPWS